MEMLTTVIFIIVLLVFIIMFITILPNMIKSTKTRTKIEQEILKKLENENNDKSQF